MALNGDIKQITQSLQRGLSILQRNCCRLFSKIKLNVKMGIIITCSDKSKVKKALFGSDESFKSVFNEIKKLVSETEQVPGGLKTSEEDE